MSLHSELFRIADWVLEVKSSTDTRPTVQSRSRILRLIAFEDSEFAEQVKAKPNITFSFGDKYFFPIDEKNLLCIPEEVDDLEGWFEKNSTGDTSDVIKDFYSFGDKLKGCGHFDVSE